MYAITAQLFLLSTIGCVISRTILQNDVIWFPKEDIPNWYESSLGEYFVAEPPQNSYGHETHNNVEFKRSTRLNRAISADRQNNFRTDMDDKDLASSFEDVWLRPDIKRATFSDEPLFFRGETNANPGEAGDCLKNCPLTPQYNPVCGTDSQNYNNLAALRCAQSCGQSVNFAHYGVCGRGLPGIFKPKPRQPKPATARTRDDLNWESQMNWPFERL